MRQRVAPLREVRPVAVHEEQRHGVAAPAVVDVQPSLWSAQDGGRWRVRTRGEEQQPGGGAPHFTFVPAGTLGSTLSSDGSPSIDAASTMPFDSIPISFAGCRLATMTTLRPTSSSGVYFVAMPATMVRSPSPVKIVILISFFDFG